MKDFLGQELFIGDNVVIVKKEKKDWNINVMLHTTKIKNFTKKYVSTENGKFTISERVIKIDTILNNMNNEDKT